MLHEILIFGFGLLVGFVLTVTLIALLSANKLDDIEQEKLQCYKQGYKKGFNDGYEQQSQVK